MREPQIGGDASPRYHAYRVPVEGLEPTCLSANDFESLASANSATPARTGQVYQPRPLRGTRLLSTVNGARNRYSSDLPHAVSRRVRLVA